jgi:hypothetical protein
MTTPDLVNEPRVLALDDALEISLNVIFKVRGRVHQAFTLMVSHLKCLRLLIET